MIKTLCIPHREVSESDKQNPIISWAPPRTTTGRKIAEEIEAQQFFCMGKAKRQRGRRWVASLEKQNILHFYIQSHIRLFDRHQVPASFNDHSQTRGWGEVEREREQIMTTERESQIDREKDGEGKGCQREKRPVGRRFRHDALNPKLVPGAKECRAVELENL